MGFEQSSDDDVIERHVVTDKDTSVASQEADRTFMIDVIMFNVSLYCIHGFICRIGQT